MKTLRKFIFLLAGIFVMSLAACVNDELAEPTSVDGVLPVIEAQASAVQKSVEDMKALAEALGEYDVDLKEVEASLEDHLTYLKGQISCGEGALAALELQKRIATAVGSVEASILAQDGYGDNLKKSFEDFHAGVASWLGECFNAYYPVMLALTKVDVVLAGLNPMLGEQQLYVDAIVSDVEAGLRKDADPAELNALAVSVENASKVSDMLSNSIASIAAEVEKEYKAAIKAMASDAASFNRETLAELNADALTKASNATPSLTELATTVKNCQTTLEDLQKRLGAVEGSVQELLGLIQSVTFMPGAAGDNAHAYYTMNVNNKVSDSSLPYHGKAQRTATGTMELTYLVRPASASTALNANLDAVSVFGYYASQISLMSVNASDYFDLTVKKVVATDVTKGLVTVTVEPRLREAFYYKEIGAKCALSIKSGKTDVTSKFVEILPRENSNNVYVQSVTPSKDVIYMKKGEYAELSASVNPSNVTTAGYDLSSSDTKVIQIDEATGKLYAYGVGTATVTVTSKGTDEWGVPVTATCAVEVEEAFMLSGAPYVEVGNTTQVFLTYPTDAIINEKVWKTSDASKLTVDADGKVTGVAHTYNTNTKEYNDVTVSCTINGVTTVSWNMKVAAVQPKKIITNGLSDNQLYQHHLEH